MKKTAFWAVVVVAVMVMASCTKVRPIVANLATDIDSLSYAHGHQVGELYFAQGHAEELDIDSANITDFIRGISEAVQAGDDRNTSAYYKGLALGRSLLSQIPAYSRSDFENDTTKTLSKNNFVAGFLDMISPRGKQLMTDSVAMSVIGDFRLKYMDETLKAHKAEGEKFMAGKASEEGVQKTASGLLYKVITEGNGPKWTEGHLVKIEYEGRFADGSVFDDNNGEPITFHPQEVIAGFSEALTMMPAGSEWEVYIPQELAYGERGQKPVVEPYTPLVFKIKLLEITQ